MVWINSLVSERCGSNCIDQNNGIVKEKYIQETFTFWGYTAVQAYKSMNYLDFVILYMYNGKYRSITHDRIMKDTRMFHKRLKQIGMCRSGLRCLFLINKLLQFFSMDIKIPKSYLIGESIEVHKCKKPCIWNYFDKLGWHISFAYARHVGRKVLDTNRRILIPINDYGDKIDLLTRGNNSRYSFDNSFGKYGNDIERVHTSFMIRTLDISKYASNKQLYGELARFLLLHNAWALGMKYWLRLSDRNKTCY